MPVKRELDTALDWEDLVAPYRERGLFYPFVGGLVIDFAYCLRHYRLNYNGKYGSTIQKVICHKMKVYDPRHVIPKEVHFIFDLLCAVDHCALFLSAQ